MNRKMTKEIVPEDFTLFLALTDAIPVIFFGASCVVIGTIFSSRLFLLGAVLCLLGGSGKVLWKIIVVVKKKNIWPLFIQMRIVMPLGFALMLCSLLLCRSRLVFPDILAAVTSQPSLWFFLIGIAGMILMGVFAVKLDSSDVKSNWAEQFTNGVSQISFFIGLLFLL